MSHRWPVSSQRNHMIFHRPYHWSKTSGEKKSEKKNRTLGPFFSINSANINSSAPNIFRRKINYVPGCRQLIRSLQTDKIFFMKKAWFCRETPFFRAFRPGACQRKFAKAPKYASSCSLFFCYPNLEQFSNEQSFGWHIYWCKWWKTYLKLLILFWNFCQKKRRWNSKSVVFHIQQRKRKKRKTVKS